MTEPLVDRLRPFPHPTEPPPPPERAWGSCIERSIDLAALPTALVCARLFVDSTLWHWGARFAEADTELLAVELTRHSIQTCGITDEHVRVADLDEVSVIHLRLLGFEHTIGIEVWDNAAQPARLPPPDPTTGLRGLALIDAHAKNWGSDLTPYGRITWAELDL